MRKNTTLVYFLKKYTMGKLFKIILWVVMIVVTVFLGFATLGFYRLDQKNKTDLAIARINSTKITLDDVMGKNLPAKPEKLLNDSTVAGFDVNNNWIRDDVELAIFEKYPNSAKIRSAELQYAQALQLELTQVFNSETLVAILEKEDYGSLCISETVIDQDIKTALELNSSRKNEIQNLVFNTEIRKEKNTDNLKKYLTTYSSKGDIRCDIDLSSLPN